MTLRKFPVVSKSGIEYEVRIKADWHLDDTYRVTLHKRYKSIFGLQRIKELERTYVYGSTFEQNFVEMAKYIVFKFESRVSDEITEDGQRLKSIGEFAEWDGKC